MAPVAHAACGHLSGCVEHMGTTTAISDSHADLMAVYVRQWDALRTLLSKRVGSRELAEDALQETWLRLASMGEFLWCRVTGRTPA